MIRLALPLISKSYNPYSVYVHRLKVLTWVADRTAKLVVFCKIRQNSPTLRSAVGYSPVLIVDDVLKARKPTLLTIVLRVDSLHLAFRIILIEFCIWVPF